MAPARRLTLAEFSRFHLEAIKAASRESTEERGSILQPASVDLPESGFARQVASGMLKFRSG